MSAVIAGLAGLLVLVAGGLRFSRRGVRYAVPCYRPDCSHTLHAHDVDTVAGAGGCEFCSCRAYMEPPDPIP